MSKVPREKIHQKYGGRCAYCGREITQKEMQVDHLIPQWKAGKIDGVYEENNLMPSCRRCNHYKRGGSLEYYRTMLLEMKRKLIDDTYLGKVAQDYGMFTWNGWDGRFFFERQGQKED